MSASPNSRVDAIRRFNRFYTRRIGVLNQGLLDSPFSLAEVRLLYELANREASTPTELGKALEIDAGYLSRLLRGLERRGLIARLASRTDGRQRHLRLTPKGRRAFASLDAEANRQVETWLRDLRHPVRRSWSKRWRRFGGNSIRPWSNLPRSLESSCCASLGPATWDGWSTAHGVLYAQEYGYD